jgi:glucose/arabinose dehydrogenase
LVALACGGASSVTVNSEGLTDSPSASASASSGLVDIGVGLQGPAGLTASRFATGIPNAAALAFDASGGLWVGTAAFTDTGTDAIYYVASEGATPVEVVSGQHTVLGLLWIDGALYASRAGGVDEYTGFDGTKFSTSKAVITFSGDIGEVNGMALSPEGRIWLGITSPCDHCATTDAYSAAVVSFLPDGSDLKVEASGIRAPIGLAYYPGTSDLFVSMDQRDDLGDATTGDALGLVTSGQDWGFPDCYGQGGSACAGAPTAVAVLDKHSAVSGVAILSDELGGAYSGSALVAEWANGKVMRVALSKSGGTYTGEVSTFLTGIQSPVAVAVSPTGDVIVGDWATGVVYRISG